MQKESLDKSIKNAVASVEMEGFHIDEQSKAWCRQLLLFFVYSGAKFEF